MLLVVAMAATFVACSLTTSLDGLTGGAEGGAAEGGAAEGGSAESGSAESGTDGPTADGGTGDGDAGEGGPIDPCAGAVLCDQFERAAPDGIWTSIYTDNGGTVTIDPTTSTSGTRSVALFVPATGNPHAQLGSPAYSNVAHARISWSMKTGSPNRSISLMRLQIDENNRASVIDIFMFDGLFVMDENVFGTPSAGYADYSLLAGFQVDTWQRWTMELDARAATAVGIVTLDGVERIRTNLKNTYAKGVLKILVGAFYAPDGPAQTLHYDDIAVTILP